MQFENQAAFEELVRNGGLNLFLGAGFSILASDYEDDKLKVGSELKEYLIEHFELHKYSNYSLPKIANYLKRTRKSDLYHILKKKFNVKFYNDKYNILTTLPIKNIFTTNIDNLCEKIYESSEDNYLSDVEILGSIESPGVNLYKLHGSITYTYDKELLFSSNELSGAFLRDSAFWHTVSLKVAAHPTLFWGTNLEDPNIIDLLNPETINNRPHSARWVMIRPDEKNDLIADEYSNNGYRIIRSDTRELLQHLGTLSLTQTKKTRSSKVNFAEIFPKNHIQTILESSPPSRPISSFFQGEEPIWSDILSGKLTNISAFSEAFDKLSNKHKVLLIGPPGSGKTTLLMQLAASSDLIGPKLFFDSIDTEQAKFLASKIQNKDLIYLFVDNLGDNIDAFKVLSAKPNIIFCLADRDLRYESIKHIAKIKKSEIIDISDLSRSDMQKICDSMERSLPVNYQERISLFELCYSLWSGGNLNDRIKSLIKQISDSSFDLLEFYILMTYVRYTGVFASMDMLICYYSDYKEIDYVAIYDFQKQIYTLIDENSPYHDYNQDYFSLRSRAFCEASLRHIPSKQLGNVLTQFHKNIHRGIIRRYDIFRRKAFDADITTKAFIKKEDGVAFYKQLLSTDNSPFIRHQFALYLWRKGDIDYAWSEIDTAYTMSQGKIWSISNTHAFILFDTNIGKEPDDRGILLGTLHNSFNVLDKCLKYDKRKSYHIITYAKQALQYYDRFFDATGEKFIDKAYQLITTELSKDQYIPKSIFHEFMQLKKDIARIKNN
ncbi:SIR2 family protein [Desulfobacter curvatus]|uniref:SIR2 family protein n=1 Tax=Desulfobacter curvatus TaxID=2290 RepID=UPI0003641945|nr:SIR2 family protein [Desulfobacter curvatus]